MRGPFFILLCALMVGSINGHPQSSGELAAERQLVDGRTYHVYEEMNGARVRGGVHTSERNYKKKNEEFYKVNENKNGNYRRRLKVATSSKIGSRPPSCKGKCKGCLPCTSLQVTVPPAQHTSPYTGPLSDHLDGARSSPYYSVAWRCTCKGKYYNP
eukprot:c40236_g1_i1 orf=399-869(+)